MSLFLAGIFQAVPDAFESVWNFFYAGKLFMVFLLALSLLSISVIISKALDLRRRQILPEEKVAAIEAAPQVIDARTAADLAVELRGAPGAPGSALGRLGLLAICGGHADKEDASRAVEARAREEIVTLESGVALLEVVITIAPLLGLLGTVSGLVSVFSNLGDSADHSAIAVGIAEALNTTIAGLAIAVPTVIAHSYFMKKIERVGVRMEVLLGRLLAALYRTEPVPTPIAVAPEESASPQPAPPAEPAATPLPIPVPTQLEPAPQIHTAVPDPGAHPYPEPHEPVAPSELPPEPPPAEPFIPRLLVGHSPQAPDIETEQAIFAHYDLDFEVAAESDPSIEAPPPTLHHPDPAPPPPPHTESAPDAQQLT